MSWWAPIVFSIALLCASCSQVPKDQTQDQPLSAELLASRKPSAKEASLKETPKKELSWWAASEQQIQKAVCRKRLPLSAAEIESYYASLPSGPEKGEDSYEVHGFIFKNERPALVEAFLKLLRSGEFEPNLFNGLGKAELPKAPENLQDKFQFPANCSKVLCASEGVFGKDVGPQMVFLMEKYNLNTSPYSFKHASLFNPDEIADVIRSLELIHPNVFSFRSKGQKLIRFQRGYTRGMYAKGTTYANSSFELYDSWEEQNSLGRQYTLFHEFSHHAARGLLRSLHETPDWLKISEWNIAENEEDTSGVELAKPGVLVSEYAGADASEDFAESVVAYRFNPSLLKKKSRDKYQFIKQIVYDGLEFESEKSCQQSPHLKTYQDQIDSERLPFSPAERRGIQRACQTEFYRVLIGRAPLSSFHHCMNYEATFIWLQKARKNWKSLEPEAVFEKDLRLSKLSFKKLIVEATPRLQEKFVDWLMSIVQNRSFSPQARVSSEVYCSAWWGSEFVEAFQEKTPPSRWSERFPHGRSATKEAVRAMCKDIIGESLKFDITRATVLKYVTAKTRPRF